LTITGDVVVTASFDFTSSDGFTDQGSDEAALSCGEPTTGGTTTGTTTGGTTTGGTTTGGTTTGTTTGGTTTGGTTTGGTTTGGTTVGETTGTGEVSSETSGGTTGGTTGGTSSAGGDLPFTGLPIWLPVLAGGLLIGVGYRLLKRRARSGA
jgi:immunomodulating metalloprotease